jgi:hypothetical protein
LQSSWRATRSRGRISPIIAHSAANDNPSTRDKDGRPAELSRAALTHDDLFPAWNCANHAAMSVRIQTRINPEMRWRAQARAAELGISFADYIRRLLAQDLGETKRKVDIFAIFDLIDEGPQTNIAADKDKMIGEAVWQQHLHKTRRRQRTREGRLT